MNNNTTTIDNNKPYQFTTGLDSLNLNQTPTKPKQVRYTVRKG